MTDAATLAVQLAAVTKDLAVADDATLQAFKAQADTGTFTLAGFVTAFATLAPSLGDPDRRKAAEDCYNQMVANLSQFDALVNQTHAEATAP